MILKHIIISLKNLIKNLNGSHKILPMIQFLMDRLIYFSNDQKFDFLNYL